MFVATLSCVLLPVHQTIAYMTLHILALHRTQLQVFCSSLCNMQTRTCKLAYEEIQVHWLPHKQQHRTPTMRVGNVIQSSSCLQAPGRRDSAASGHVDDDLDGPGLRGALEGVVRALHVGQLEAVRDQLARAQAPQRSLGSACAPGGVGTKAPDHTYATARQFSLATKNTRRVQHATCGAYTYDVRIHGS